MVKCTSILNLISAFSLLFLLENSDSMHFHHLQHIFRVAARPHQNLAERDDRVPSRIGCDFDPQASESLALFRGNPPWLELKLLGKAGIVDSKQRQPILAIVRSDDVEFLYGLTEPMTRIAYSNFAHHWSVAIPLLTVFFFNIPSDGVTRDI